MGLVGQWEGFIGEFFFWSAICRDNSGGWRSIGLGLWKGDWNPGAGKIYKDKLCGWKACGCGKGGCLMCTRDNWGGQGGGRVEVGILDRQRRWGRVGRRATSCFQPTKETQQVKTSDSDGFRWFCVEKFHLRGNLSHLLKSLLISSLIDSEGSGILQI